jgi:hypothetical protein
MSGNKQQLQFAQLVLLALQGDISQEQSRVLTDTLNSDPKALSLYVSLMEIYTELSPLGSVRIPPISKPQSDGQAENLNKLINILAAEENDAVILDVPKPVNPKPISKPDEMPVVVRKVSKFNLWTIGLSMAALLFMITYLKIMPYFETVSVATMTDSMGAEYGSGSFPAGSPLANRKNLYSLQKGITKIEFDSGVTVVIEAPAEFTPLSANKMLLRKGKAFAHVPADAIGFTIDTPVSSIIDLGTEFGVYVDEQNSSQVYVAQGKVNLIAGLSGQTRQSEIVQQTQARQVGPAGRMIEKVDFSNNFFVRDISSRDKTISYGNPLNLAWVLAGSYGFTPAQDTGGIDPATGQYNPTVTQQMDRKGTNSYHPVTDRMFIDGVFVPNGPCVVSSAEHRFAGFPYTTNQYWSDVTSNPAMISNKVDENNKVIRQEILTVSLYHDTDISPVPLIFIHPNQGITFDLDHIRQAQPGTEISRFQAKCGISRNISKFAKMRSEFWVLIDGKQFFHHTTERIPGEKMGTFSQEQISDVKTIDIPILPNQRFLTLAATDGGDSSAYDWCVFENPVLSLVPARMNK